MSSGKLSFSNTKYISEEEHRILSARCYPEKGDILISKVGTTGIPLIIDTDKEFSIFVSLALIKFFPSYIDSKFLIYLIKSPLIQEQVKRDTRGVGNKNWVLTAIANTLLAIPPLAEQQRIVSKIEDIMPIAEKYDRSQDALDKLNAEIYDKLKKSVLQAAIQGKLVPQHPNDEPTSVLIERIKEEKAKLFRDGKLKKKDLLDSVIFKGEDNKYYEKTGNSEVCIDEEVPFEIPESWIWARLGDIAAISAGGTPERTNNRYWNNGDIPWLKISDVTSSTKYLTRATEFITQEGLENSSAKIYKKGTILYTIFATVGEVAILDFDSTCNQAIAGIDLYDKELTSWVYYFLANLKDYIISISKGCAQLNINQKILKSVLIPIPPKKEQTRIISCLDEIISSIMSR